MTSSATNNNSDSVFSMLKLGFVLAIYAVVCCTVLAIINSLTSPVIASNQQKKANEAMKAVFRAADDFVSPQNAIDATQDAGGITLDNLMLAKSNGKIIGAVAQVTGPTYDHSTIMVGMDTDGIITGMQYLENTDTPGFGQKGSDPTFTLSNGKTFYGQFEGKKASDGFVTGVTFDAISGATITSNGIASLMTQASKWMESALEANK